jgi:hypothetical protein
MLAERKTRDEVLRLVRDGRAELEAALAGIPEERIEEPVLDGGWSAKDLMAHVAHSCATMAAALGDCLAVGGSQRERLQARLRARARKAPGRAYRVAE